MRYPGVIINRECGAPAGTSIASMVLKNSNLDDAGIKAQPIAARFVDAQPVSHAGCRHRSKRMRVVRSIDDPLVHSKAARAAARTVDRTGGLGVRRKGREPAGHERHLPRPFRLGRTRITSGGGLFSFFTRTGDVATKGGTTFAGQRMARPSRRLPRSVAIMTHSWVK
jgi:hypothetical protein